MLKQYRCWVMVLGLAAMVAGCSKQATDETQPPPLPPEPPAPHGATSPVPDLVAPQSPAPGPLSTNPPAIKPVRLIPAPDPSSPTAEMIEADYLAATDLRTKLEHLDDLSSTDPVGAVEALGRLFHLEPDLELKEEILNQLAYIEGEDQRKMLLLEEATDPAIAKSVRREAISLILEEGNLDGVTVLQKLVNDADPEIRQEAIDAIEELKAE